MKILIAGLNNYLARNLAVCLAAAHHDVTCLVRNKKLFQTRMPGNHHIQLQEADLFMGTYPAGLDKETKVAFYFNQSPVNELDIRLEMELVALQKYIRGLKSTGCEHLIYVTKLTDENVDSIESYISRSGLDHTVIRVSNIVGKGSVLMDVFAKIAKRKLVLLPKEFAASHCQPIHLTDVCVYLDKMMCDPRAYGKVFDVGGPDVMTYKDAFERYRDIAKSSKWNLVALPRLGVPISVWLGRYIYRFEQDVSAAFAACMRQDTVVVNDGIQVLYPMRLASLNAAIHDAIG